MCNNEAPKIIFCRYHLVKVPNIQITSKSLTNRAIWTTEAEVTGTLLIYEYDSYVSHP